MKFGVLADLHYNAIPHAERRLDDILADFKKKDVDFFVDLGDLCPPFPENEHIVEKVKNCGIPCHFVLGNHNTDRSYEKALKFFGLENGYYSVVHDNVKFIILDTNYAKTKNGLLKLFEYKNKSADDLFPYVPQKEIEWLKNELADDNYYYIICSHHSLSNDFKVKNKPRGVANREEIREILEKKNKESGKILFCLNGHDHGGSIKKINEITYYTLNSASYIWQDIKESFNYSKEMHEKYPYLKGFILYKEALHIIVTIDENMNVKIDGMDGSYDNITPKDLGMGDTFNGVSIAPKAPSLFIPR